MASRIKKEKPIDQGSLRALAKFFEPLIKSRPDHIPFRDWLENVIFHVHERTIEAYVTLQGFRMPGSYYWLPTKPIQGYGRRAIKPGTEIIARFDSRQPDVVDVETITKQREQPRVFRLTRDEWDRAKANLKKNLEPYEYTN